MMNPLNDPHDNVAFNDGVQSSDPLMVGLVICGVTCRVEHSVRRMRKLAWQRQNSGKAETKHLIYVRIIIESPIPSLGRTIVQLNYCGHIIRAAHKFGHFYQKMHYHRHF